MLKLSESPGISFTSQRHKRIESKLNQLRNLACCSLYGCRVGHDSAITLWYNTRVHADHCSPDLLSLGSPHSSRTATTGPHILLDGHPGISPTCRVTLGTFGTHELVDGYPRITPAIFLTKLDRGLPRTGLPPYPLLQLLSEVPRWYLVHISWVVLLI